VNTFTRSYYTAMNTQAENLGFDFFKPPKNSVPPTIMQILPSLNSGGVERGTIEMSEAIVSSGWNSVVVSDGGALVDKLTCNGAKHIKIPAGSKNPFDWYKSYKQLKTAISDNNVSLVHARSRMPAWVSLKAAKENKVPFVTTFHGRYPDTNFAKKLYNSVMVRGDRVIAISRYVADEILRRYDIRHEQLRIIPRGADLDAFNSESILHQQTEKLIQEWDIDTASPLIILPARITRWKGQELLIDALSQIKDMPFVCLLIGSYSEKQTFKSTLEALIRKKDLNSRVKIVGHCPDMAAAYKMADVVVSASLDPEPFGRVAVEAQAMGRILVAADHGGARETVLSNVTGVLVEPRDAGSLAKGIKKALTMSLDQQTKMSEAAIQHIKANFSRTAMCYRTISLYCEILGFSPKGVS